MVYHSQESKRQSFWFVLRMIEMTTRIHFRSVAFVDCNDTSNVKTWHTAYFSSSDSFADKTKAVSTQNVSLRMKNTNACIVKADKCPLQKREPNCRYYCCCCHRSVWMLSLHFSAKPPTGTAATPVKPPPRYLRQLAKQCFWEGTTRRDHF